MYRTVCVAVDRSAHSRNAAAVALELASAFDARLLALAVTGSTSSSRRRERLLAALPAGAATATGTRTGTGTGTGTASAVLAEAPTAHSTLAWLEAEARSRKVGFEAREIDGRPFEAILGELRDGGQDLLVLGALGEGAEESGESAGGKRTLGATCERVVRRARTDVLVVRRPPSPGAVGAEAALGTGEGSGAGAGYVLSCIDGSPQSYAGLLSGIELSRAAGRPLEATAVYDPYLHYTLFNGIVGVLSEKASKVFKFKDQEKLHEEIIDTGLAKIYQAHLEVARHVASEKDVDLKITLLDGKAHQKVAKHAAKTSPGLVLLGRIGVHSTDEMDVGATTENLLRTLECNVLVTSRQFVPPVDVRAQESVQWVPEALAKMERVPSFVRGVARTAIIRWAIERGHSIITPSVINSCMGDILPKSAAQAMGWVAEETAKADAPAEGSKSFVCSECGHAAKDYRPQACPVCRSGSEQFQEIDRNVIASLGELERGAIEVEETFDGRSLSWTAEAKDVLRRVPNGYERRRAKARIEKTAKVRGLATIDEAFALDMVQQEMADTSYLSAKGERLTVEVKNDERPDDATPRVREESPLPWTDAAWKRISRVPAGFMRDMTREKVEQFAASREASSVDLALCEEGIAEGRRLMAEMIGSYGKDGAAKEAIRRAAGAPPSPPATGD